MILKHRATPKIAKLTALKDKAVQMFGNDINEIFRDLFRNLFDDLVKFKEGYIHRTAVAGVDYTALQDDFLISYTTLSTGVTTTIPNPASIGEGKRYIIKDEAGNAGTHNIAIDDDSGTVDTISSNDGKSEVYSDGSAWIVL